ncbi:hydroxyacid dehydrogenase [Alcaligenes endophyticus]|uniref:Hydroxyacid dehydrogenase n=1 Tax=Alcaligenes endophyticus TaxID=1929088 RepID=A0ABT8EJU8_9BURK|nr:hydroxyacid dehydrogenase [Alcaligenes endophyticus]MCX5591861.1 hydroxyacid dehydrogenase [Alcaligenes endophyticus]MDN4121551.1 hydroxyacid dehydrogenase [Alcaligenes endophyticus]
MKQGKVLVTGADLAQQACALLANYDIIYTGKTPTQESIVELCKQHNPVAIIVRYSGVNAAAMAAAPALKVISKHGSGTDTIDKEAAKTLGIAVVAASGVNATSVAEHTLALLMACAKSVPYLNHRMHQGHWDKATHKNLELSGLTIGLVGLGAIGVRFAKMAHAMDMPIIGFDPYAKNLPSYIQQVSLEALWKKADIISFHCPLTESTHHLLNKTTLAQCKPGVIIINTARGGLIDEAALLEAINSKHVSGAGLDSFETEPMPQQHPFHQQAAIVLSPHIAGVTNAAYENMGIAAAKNILTVLNQELTANSY